MYSAIDIASYIFYHYPIKNNRKMDEMRLHKLLYLSQRESIIRTGTILFKEQFEAWVYGPVMIAIRPYYKRGKFPKKHKIDEIAKSIIDYVISTYSNLFSWTPGMRVYDEISWQKAREGIPIDENGHNLISNEDIKLDAERMKTMCKTKIIIC